MKFIGSKFKDETPSRTVHKDLGRLLDQLHNEHFSDLIIYFTDKEGGIKEKIHTYYPIVEKRAPLLIEDVKEIEQEEVKILESYLEIPDEFNIEAIP